MLLLRLLCMHGRSASTVCAAWLRRAAPLWSCRPSCTGGCRMGDSPLSSLLTCVLPVLPSPQSKEEAKESAPAGEPKRVPKPDEAELKDCLFAKFLNDFFWDRLAHRPWLETLQTLLETI